MQWHADKQLGQEASQVYAEDLQVPRSKLLNTSSDAVQRGEVDLQHLHISRWLCVGAQTMTDNLQQLIYTCYYLLRHAIWHNLIIKTKTMD